MNEPITRPLIREARWRRFPLTALGVGGGLVLLVHALVLVIDPHDHFALSRRIERAPVDTNQRLSYPAIARKPRFDGVVIGTSTAWLLRPDRLAEALDGERFANLAMNSATAYEQSRLLEVWRRDRPRATTVLFGIDQVWRVEPARFERYTFRKFPDWYYDERAFSALPHLFNWQMLEEATRQVQYFVGRREPRYGHDGYRGFLPDPSEYDVPRARQNIFGAGGPRPRAAGAGAFDDTHARTGAYPALDLLAGLLRAIPAETLKLLVFVPDHVFTQPAPGTLGGARLQECKRRTVELARAVPDAHVVDFMIDSDLTRRDEHYWDPLHYTEEIADRLVEFIGRAARERRDAPDLYRYLARPG